MEYKEMIADMFFQDPMGQFGIRELARQLHINSKTIMKYLKEFVKCGIVVKVKEKGKFAHYEANRLSKRYKMTKSNALMDKIASSGLVDYLERELNPRAIVIFGSVQKGTYTKDSDIDIFIQGKEKKINIDVFERKIGKEIQLLFEEKLGKLSEGLKNNIINGSTISGGLEL